MNMKEMNKKKYNGYDILINTIYVSIVSSITSYLANIYFDNKQKKKEE